MNRGIIQRNLHKRILGLLGRHTIIGLQPNQIGLPHVTVHMLTHPKAIR